MSTTKTYVIYDDLYYKIGKTNNLEKRLSSIKTGNVRARLLYYFDDNIEKELHSKFKNKRVGGEWFDLSEEDLLYIETNFLKYVKKNKEKLKKVLKKKDSTKDIDFKGEPFIILNNNGVNRYIFNPIFNFNDSQKKSILGKNSSKIRRKKTDEKIYKCIDGWDTETDGKITLSKIAKKVELGEATLKRRGKELKHFIEKINNK